MKHRKPPLAAKIRTEAAQSYLGPDNLAEDVEANPRISSLMPHVVMLFVLIGAAAAFGFTTKQWFSSGRIPWALLALGIMHAVVALAGFARWKRVRRGADHYHVSDFIRSETISLVDVCMVVEERGFIWNSVHIHFRRLTRFGWSVSYVPIGSARWLDWLVAGARFRGASKPRAMNGSFNMFTERSARWKATWTGSARS